MIISFKYSETVGFIDIRIASGEYDTSQGFFRDTKSNIWYSGDEIDFLRKNGWANKRDRSLNIIYTVDTILFIGHDYTTYVIRKFLDTELPKLKTSIRDKKIEELGI